MILFGVVQGQRSVSTPTEYLQALDEPRRAELAALDALIRETAPSLKPVIHGGMLGYGPYHYKYATGREGDTCHISLASNKNYISLYVLVTDNDGYLAERYKDALPKASIGKSCVRFRHLSDVSLELLRALVRHAAEQVGRTASATA